MSVFKRPGSPFYYTNFQIAGRKFLRSTKRTTEREARQEERRIKADERAKLKERAGASNSLSIDQGFGRYWKEHGHKLAWASEVERYIGEILKRVDPQMLIEDLTDADVNDFVQQWDNDERGAYALNRSLAIWRAMHRRASKKWRQKTSEIDWADFLNDEEKRVRHATVEEMRALIDASRPSLAVAIEWSLYTGCRKSETYGLAWDEVFLDRGQAIVTAKGGRRHTVWLTEQAMDLLGRLERRGRYVFDRRGQRRAFANSVKAVGLQDFCWHDLRHTHATWLRQAGAPVEVVQRSLGHADIATTMRYAHVDDSELREALRRLPSVGITPAKIISIKRARKAE